MFTVRTAVMRGASAASIGSAEVPFMRARACGRRGTARPNFGRPVGMLLLALVTLAGCGSAGVHAQDPASTSRTQGPRSTSTTDTAISGPPSPTWTPPSYGNAQPAVDAYLAMLQAGYAAFRDPTHANTTTIDKYADGDIRYVYRQTLEQARKAGIAYRGTPATPRVTVVSVAAGSLPKVVLRDCALSSTSDPWIAYSVESGKPVPTPTPAVAPPYANTISVFKTQGSWRVFTVKTDGTRTCQP